MLWLVRPPPIRKRLLEALSHSHEAPTLVDLPRWTEPEALVCRPVFDAMSEGSPSSAPRAGIPWIGRNGSQSGSSDFWPLQCGKGKLPQHPRHAANQLIEECLSRRPSGGQRGACLGVLLSFRHRSQSIRYRAGALADSEDHRHHCAVGRAIDSVVHHRNVEAHCFDRRMFGICDESDAHRTPQQCQCRSSIEATDLLQGNQITVGLERSAWSRADGTKGANELVAVTLESRECQRRTVERSQFANRPGRGFGAEHQLGIRIPQLVEHLVEHGAAHLPIVWRHIECIRAFASAIRANELGTDLAGEEPRRPRPVGLIRWNRLGGLIIDQETPTCFGLSDSTVRSSLNPRFTAGSGIRSARTLTARAPADHRLLGTPSSPESRRAARLDVPLEFGHLGRRLRQTRRIESRLAGLQRFA